MSKTASVMEKRIRLSSERADRLRAVAEAQGVDEEEIILRLLDIFLRGAEALEGEINRHTWHTLGLAGFERAWDNEEDAIYDNWRGLYGISEGGRSPDPIPVH